MVQAFRSLGFDVVEVCGHDRVRLARIHEVRRRLRSANHGISLLYGESSNTATAMNERHHLPLHPLADPALFRDARAAGVPTGLFYRDVYWRFALFREEVPWTRRLPAVAGLHYDWWWYRRHVDTLFVPSLRMAQSLPSSWPAHRLVALPPGCDIELVSSVGAFPLTAADRPLRLLYVGAVGPPLYDIAPLLAAVGAVDGVELVICCRAEDAAGLGRYEPLPASVSVVHVHGVELARLYEVADVAAAVYEPHGYRSFAMPVKVFEAFSHHTPVIASGGTAVADLVAAEGAGWVIDGVVDLADLLRSLVADRVRVDRVRQGLRAVVERNTWTRRAGAVVEALLDRSEVS